MFELRSNQNLIFYVELRILFGPMQWGPDHLQQSLVIWILKFLNILSFFLYVIFKLSTYFLCLQFCDNKLTDGKTYKSEIIRQA